jgi:hypothetical protein
MIAVIAEDVARSLDFRATAHSLPPSFQSASYHLPFLPIPFTFSFSFPILPIPLSSLPLPLPYSLYPSSPF